MKNKVALAVHHPSSNNTIPKPPRSLNDLMTSNLHGSIYTLVFVYIVQQQSTLEVILLLGSGRDGDGILDGRKNSRRYTALRCHLAKAAREIFLFMTGNNPSDVLLGGLCDFLRASEGAVGMENDILFFCIYLYCFATNRTYQLVSTISESLSSYPRMCDIAASDCLHVQVTFELDFHNLPCQ